MCSRSLPLSETVFSHIPNRHNNISDDDSLSRDFVKMNSICKRDVYMLSRLIITLPSDCGLLPLVPATSIVVLNSDSGLC